jgi:hypothetical protein
MWIKGLERNALQRLQIGLRTDGPNNQFPQNSFFSLMTRAIAGDATRQAKSETAVYSARARHHRLQSASTRMRFCSPLTAVNHERLKAFSRTSGYTHH